MRAGILAGLTWAIETMLLSGALNLPFFAKNLQLAFLAPFICAFLHDSCSSLLLAGQGAWRAWQRQYWWIVLAAAIGGPVGMTGYVLAVKFMGPALGAVACAIFPAAGAVLAYLILGEQLTPARWGCLLATLLGVYGLSASSHLATGNLLFGLASAIMCAGGWGLEAVILAKCLKGGAKPSHALQIRQTASAIVSGLLLLALLPAGIFFHPVLGQGRLWLFIAFASAFATVSYLFYYKAIDQLGPSKAMALNVTSSAWAYLFTVFSGQWDLVNGKSLFFALLVFAGSILTAGDWQELFKRGDH